MNLTKDVDLNVVVNVHAAKPILFIFICLAAGAFLQEVLKKTQLPYTVVLFVLGMGFGVLSHRVEGFHIYTAITRMDASILMTIFLPPLLFESAYSMDAHIFIYSVIPCIILAVPGLLLCTVLTASYSMTALSVYHWNWETALLFGSILSATDPVAVVALFKECGISQTLTTLVEGESLLNDGSAIVAFHVLLEIVVANKMGEGAPIDGVKILIAFIRITVGAPIFGIFMGFLATRCLLMIFKDSVLEFTVTLCFAYITYFLSETTFHISGVLAVVVLGVIISANKSNFSPDTEEAVHHFWEMLSYFANTLIFIIVGIIIAERAVLLQWSDVGMALCTYMFITVARGIMILVMYPLLNMFGYGLTWKNAIALIWGGLRGAVGMSLALVLLQDPTVDNETIAFKITSQLSMCIFLTLLVNGLTMKMLLSALGMNKVSHSHQIAMAHAVDILRHTAEKSRKVQMASKYFSGANWVWVESKTHIDDPFNKKGEFDNMAAFSAIPNVRCDKCDASVSLEPTAEERVEMEEEARERFLMAIKYLYWDYFEHSIVTRHSVLPLISTVDDALDKPGMFVDLQAILHKHMEVPNSIYKMKVFFSRMADKVRAEDIVRRDADLMGLKKTSSGLQSFCLKVMINPLFDFTILLLTLSNLISIIQEQRPRLLPYILTLITEGLIYICYIIEIIVKMLGLGFTQYFRSHWNKYSFLLILLGTAEVIVDMTPYGSSLQWKRAPVVTILGCLRLIRVMELIKVYKRCFASSVLVMQNWASSYLYFAYDFGLAVVTAHEEVLDKIDFVTAYKPCGTKPVSAGELCIEQVTKTLASIQATSPAVVMAVKTHKASLIILNDVLVSLKELFDDGLIDDNEHKRLTKVVDSLIQNVMMSPKILKSSNTIEDIIREIYWVGNEEIYQEIMKNHVIKDYKAYQTIHEVGDEPSSVLVIISGIVKVVGKLKEKWGNSLSNTDSVMLFREKPTFFEFLGANQSLGVLGYLNDEKFVSLSVCQTDVRALHVSNAMLRDIERSITSKPPLSYLMWRELALKIALPILQKQVTYKGKSSDELKIKLEKALLPDLSNRTSFKIDPDVETAIVIQGKCRDAAAGILYIGPSCIASRTKNLSFDDDPENRPRVVVLLLAADNYALSEDLNWSGFDSEITRQNLCHYHAVQHRRNTMASIALSSSFDKVTFKDQMLKHFQKYKRGNSSTLPLHQSQS